MIKCRGARAADGSQRFITGILSFYLGKYVTLDTFSVRIYRVTIEAFEFVGVLRGRWQTLRITAHFMNTGLHSGGSSVQPFASL